MNITPKKKTRIALMTVVLAITFLVGNRVSEAIRYLVEGRNIQSISYLRISFSAIDLVVGAALAAVFCLNAGLLTKKKWRAGVEYGSARWSA